MKATVKQVVECYNVLDKAKATKLEVSDVIKILDARKAMRPTATDYDAFLKDCQEKFKPEDWDSIQKDLQQWQNEGENTTLSEERRIELNKAVIGYQNNINKALKSELEREIELDIEPLSKEARAKLMVENGWSIAEYDIVENVL